MKIEVPYGKEGHQTLIVPDANYLGTSEAERAPAFR